MMEFCCSYKNSDNLSRKDLKILDTNFAEIHTDEINSNEDISSLERLLFCW